MTALRHEDDAPRGFITKAEHYAALREIDRLRDEVEQYREALGEMIDDHRIAMVRQFLASKRPERPHPRWASKQMARALIILVDRDRLLRSQVVDARAADRDNENCIRVLICQLRSQLAVLGAPAQAVETVRGTGYVLTPEARAWLRERFPEAFGAKP